MHRMREDLRRWGEPLCALLPRPLEFAEPFFGIGGLREFGKISRLNYKTWNGFDTDRRLRGFYNALGGLDGEEEVKRFSS